MVDPNEKDSPVSPVYTDIEKLKRWIERTHNVKITGKGPNWRGWPSFALEDGRVIEYENDVFTPGTRRIAKRTKYHCYSSPRTLETGGRS